MIQINQEVKNTTVGHGNNLPLNAELWIMFMHDKFVSNNSTSFLA